MTTTSNECPLPQQPASITMAHGGGGRLMQQLISDVFQRRFDNPLLNQGHDGAMFPSPGRMLAFTTDSFVVRPLFFPGGSIGSLAVNGTVNDLAMCGARPTQLCISFIIEEGTALELLESIADDVAAAAEQAGIPIVTGDTKVIGRSDGDGVLINTAGIGEIPDGRSVSAATIADGDVLILSAALASHGMAVMAAREGLSFEPAIHSDCAPLHNAVEALFHAGIDVHCLRDATRGGLASTCIELAQTAGNIEININESALPVHNNVRGACELLGMDPLYVANEGCFSVFVPAAQADDAIACLQQQDVGREACHIGSVSKGTGQVFATTAYKTRRALHLLSGEQLPRIC